MKPFRAAPRALQRWSLRRRQYAGGAAVLDALYDKPDPWNLASDAERIRFEATNALIRATYPSATSLIEIGCGEGIQTRHLAKLAAHVTGIDISPTALNRARIIMPEAVLFAGELAALRPMLPRSRYDVATLCEVLYYMPDPAATIACAQDLASHVVVTTYQPLARRLEPLLRGKGWRAGHDIDAGRKKWKTYIWTASSCATAQPG
ncbi:MAG: class I SAM-dependent methyltransferase [Sphingobium sp.]